MFRSLRAAFFYLNVAGKGMWLGNEHGHQVWLSESRLSPPTVHAFIDRFEKAFKA